MSKEIVPVKDKYTLTLKEASAYFNIGEKRMRRYAEDGLGNYSIFNGNRYLIIRTKFEEYLSNPCMN